MSGGAPLRAVERVDDPPREADVKPLTLYVVRGAGERGDEAFRAVLRCPAAGCDHLLHLPVGPRDGGNWTLRDGGGTDITITPSYHMTGSCGAHLSIRGGRIVWHGPGALA